MNCANHADASAVAYCRTCGKALCANCTRPVRGVIYCEDCLGSRMEGASVSGGAPASGFVPPPIGAVPPVMPPPRPVPIPVPSGPNPTVAGILAGFFPFGVGSVYTGQYAKGLAHLAIFGLLVAGCNAASESSHSDLLGVICGLGLAFFYVYQIIDAVRSARALQAGMPPPDPYGLAASFGAGTFGGGGPKTDTSSKIPASAIVLILLGAVFLLHTAGIFENGFDKFWPVLLMGLGAWLFARNYGLLGAPASTDPRSADPRFCRQRLVGPALVFTIGVLCLLDTTNVAGFNRTWPVILLFVGVAKLLQGSRPGIGSATSLGSGFAPPPAPPPPMPPSSPAASSEGKSSEVNHG